MFKNIETQQMNNDLTSLTATTVIKAPIDIVWAYWTIPEHMSHWNNTSDDWHTPQAENDLRVGGKLLLRMEKKDGKEGFDFICIYDDIVTNQKISYTTSDNRKSTILFAETAHGVILTEIFEPENHTPINVQQQFCQSILNNFKRYVENENK